MNKQKKYKINKILRFLIYFNLYLFILVTISLIVISINLEYEIPELETIELYDSENNKYLSYSNGKKKSYVALSELNTSTINAFLSIEDKRFYTHTGLDFIRICKAAIVDIVTGSTKEGASTITQQYARNLFLTTNKTWKRKFLEMIIALNLEHNYTKDEILEGYLNSIYFNHGIYGIEDASLYYFNKTSNNLSLAEACVLAAIPKGPALYSPVVDFEKNKTRKELILNELLTDELITLEEYEQAIAEEIIIYGKNNTSDNISAPYYQDYILSILDNIPFIDQYIDKGLKVYTTLNQTLNEQIIKAIDKYLSSSTLEAAIICIDPRTGGILSLIGGKDYEKSTYNRIIKSKRQVASTIKPFLYLTALQNGFTIATTFKSEETTFYINNTSYTPSNYLNIYPNTDVSMLYALATSDNIYAVKTHLFLGTNKLISQLKNFGITSDIPNVASLALGTSEISFMEWAQAYSALANEGKMLSLYGIEKITTFDNVVIYENTANYKYVASSDDIYILNEAMTNIFDYQVSISIRPTGASIANKLNYTYAAKSGSTDSDYWMIGYTPNFLCLVWIGDDNNEKITNKKDMLAAKYIWADIIETYFKDHEYLWYETPTNILAYDLDPITGFYPSFNSYHKLLYFKKDNLPWYLRF